MGEASQPKRKLLIRRATVDDVDAIMRIEYVSFPTPWSRATYQREIATQNGGIYLVAEADGELAGYIGAWAYAGEVHVLTIAVAPAFRRQGIGEILMLAMLKQAAQRGASRVFLEYRITNKPAEALYAKLGFRVVGRRPGYYRDTGEDAILASFEGPATEEGRLKIDEMWQRWTQEHGQWELCLEA